MTTSRIHAAERALLNRLNPSNSKSPQKLKRWIARSVVSLLATGIGVGIGLSVWPLYFGNSDRQPPKPDAPSLTAAPVLPAPAAAPDTSISVLGTDSSISEKPLQLVLVGTTPGRTPRDGTALLGTDPRNPQTYGVGSVLANGAVVEEIHSDHVVLTLDGRRLSVAVDRDAPTRTAMKDTLAQSKNASPTVIKSLSIPTGTNAATLIGGTQAVKRPIERTATSRDDFSEVMRSEVVFEREKVAGLRIFPGTRPAALAQLGLQDGDIVRSVEGKLVDGEAAWQAIDDAVSTGASIVVGVERDGSLMSVSLDGARLTPSESAMPAPLPNT